MSGAGNDLCVSYACALSQIWFFSHASSSSDLGFFSFKALPATLFKGYVPEPVVMLFRVKFLNLLLHCLNAMLLNLLFNCSTESQVFQPIV